MNKTDPNIPSGQPCSYCGRPVWHGDDYIRATQKNTKKVTFAHQKCAYSGKETKK